MRKNGTSRAFRARRSEPRRPIQSLLESQPLQKVSLVSKSCPTSRVKKLSRRPTSLPVSRQIPLESSPPANYSTTHNISILNSFAPRYFVPNRSLNRRPRVSTLRNRRPVTLRSSRASAAAFCVRGEGMEGVRCLACGFCPLGD